MHILHRITGRLGHAIILAALASCNIAPTEDAPDLASDSTSIASAGKHATADVHLAAVYPIDTKCLPEVQDCTPVPEPKDRPPKKLLYYGGPIISNPRVVQMRYGTGIYIPEITRSNAPNLSSFYSQILSNGILDWLKEYPSDVPPRSIGRGALYGSVEITPTAARNGATIADTQIQAELANQIARGVLPAPDNNLIYMINFPQGKTISAFGAQSCVDFCGYHNSFKSGSQNVYYAVLPDLTTGCAIGCGSGTTFENQTSVASHELVETLTDPDVAALGAGAAPAAPVAWFDPVYHEIGDLCNQVPGPFTGTDGLSYIAQQEWSNQSGQCILTRATPRNEADIFWRGTNGDVTLWQMSGGQIQSQTTTGSPDAGWTSQGIGDFDGDGLSDVFWRCTGPSCFQTTHGQLAIWYTGQQSNPIPSYPGLVSDDGWKIVGIGDFDGNGRSDVLWQFVGPSGQTSHGQLAIWYDGQQTLPVPGFPAVVSDDNWKLQGIADFDGDGRSDILWRYVGSSGTPHGQMAIWWSGQSANPVPAFPGVVADDQWRFKGVGDFDGNGKGDILWQYTGSTGQTSHGQLAIWLNGQSTSPTPTFPAVVSDDNWTIIGIGDFDGDSKSDVLWRFIGPSGQTTHGQLSIWSGAQSTNPLPGFPGVVGDNLLFQGTGSFN